MKRKSAKPHLVRVRIGVVTHQVAWFFGEPPGRWLIIACEVAHPTTPPRHYRIPTYAKLTRFAVDCMTCLVAEARILT